MFCFTMPSVFVRSLDFATYFATLILVQQVLVLYLVFLMKVFLLMHTDPYLDLCFLTVYFSNGVEALY